MKRVDLNGKTYLIGYHTQEWRPKPLDHPIVCRSFDAWLGVGFYFWTEEEFAHHWGQMFKMKTGAYDIYRAYIDIENCINAVFDEDGYFYFRKQVEKAISFLKSQGHSTITLQQVHRFLADKIWPNTHPPVSGILYDDIPQNPKDRTRVYSEITPLYYKKRIQVVLFKLEYITEFELFVEEQS
jgi:hypothetical protein